MPGWVTMSRFNRTFLVLKQEMVDVLDALEHGFNRTFLVLKRAPEIVQLAALVHDRFNRTFLVLKQLAYPSVRSRLARF